MPLDITVKKKKKIHNLFHLALSDTHVIQIVIASGVSCVLVTDIIDQFIITSIVICYVKCWFC